MKALENKVPPPVVLVGMALLMGGVTYADSASRVASALLLPVGLALVVAGWFVVMLGFRTLRRAQTTIDPTRPETASRIVGFGIYRLTRNPMYVGFATMLLGWASVLSHPLTLVGPALFILFTHWFQIRPEERALEAKFGEEYNLYVRQVPRWLGWPRVGAGLS